MGMWSLTWRCSRMVCLGTWMSRGLNIAVVSEKFCHLVLYFLYMSFIKLLVVLIPYYLNWSKWHSSPCALCLKLIFWLQKQWRFSTNFLQWFINFYWHLNVSCQHLMVKHIWKVQCWSKFDAIVIVIFNSDTLFRKCIYVKLTVQNFPKCKLSSLGVREEAVVVDFFWKPSLKWILLIACFQKQCMTYKMYIWLILLQHLFWIKLFAAVFMLRLIITAVGQVSIR